MLSTLRNQQQYQHHPYSHHTSSNLDRFGSLSRTPLTPRERYLASLAETKAAEADFIASEAEKLYQEREEEEELFLRRRLREIEAHRRQRSSQDEHYPSHYHHHERSQDSYPSRDRLSLLRRELEAEELRAARERKQHAERELLKREAERIALLRQQEAARFELARRRREQEEQRLLELRRAAAAASPQRRLVRFADDASVPKAPQTCPRHDASNATRRALELESVLAKVLGYQNAAQTAQPTEVPKFAVPKPSPNDVLRDLLRAQEGQRRPTKAPSPAKPAVEETSIASPEDFVKLLFGLAGEPTQKPSSVPTAGPVSSTSKARQTPEGPQDFLRMLLGGQVPTVEKPANKSNVAGPSAQSSSSVPQANRAETSPKRPSSPTTSLKEQLEARLGNDESVEIRDTIQAIMASLADSNGHKSHVPSSTPVTSAAASGVAGSSKEVKAPAHSSSPFTAVKEQLRARLGTEEAVEIHDTIQAILASLADASQYESRTKSIPTPSGSQSTPAPASTTSSPDNKGKKRVDSTPVAATPSSLEPTSNDVLKSMETVHNIAAAFTALQQDFVFPSQLDFTPTSSAASSPVSSDTESSTQTISKLAYTSRNHPVRYYEQSLTGLLSQLDEVESFGNVEVRTRRKEVVERVEGALDELEREVEGRWKVRSEKERKDREQEEVKEKEADKDAPSPQAAAAAADFVVLDEVAAVPTQVDEASDAPVHVDEPQSTSDTSEVITESHESPSVEIQDTPVSDAPETAPSEAVEPLDHQEPESEADTLISPLEHQTVEGSGDSHVEAATEPHDAVSPAALESESSEVAPVEAEEPSSEDVPDSLTLEESHDATSTYGTYPPSQSISTAIEETMSLSAQYPPSVASSTTSSAAASVATIRPHDVQDIETASTSSEEDEEDRRDMIAEVESDSDGFLLSEKVADETDGKKRKLEEDVGSDWSEVEA